jgi:nucleoside-diphosphate-sugar epimerase
MIMKNKKTALVLGAGGFIGNHMVSRLKKEGYSFVRGVDLKYPEFSRSEADEFIVGDLRDHPFVERVVQFKGYSGNFYNFVPSRFITGFDEIYQYAADMGGAGYIFTGEHDADVMHNSASINLNVLDSIRGLNDLTGKNKTKVFYSSSACFVEGTKVLTSEGFLPIESITTDHKVMAEDGKWHKVTETHKKNYVGDLVEIHALGGNKIVCTPDHRFLLDDKTWKKAENIKGKYIFEVVPDLSGSEEVQIIENKENLKQLWNELDGYDGPIYKLAEKYKVTQLTPYKWDKMKRQNKFPVKLLDPILKSSIKKDYDLGWLLGLILSEGWIETNSHCDTQRLVICLGKHELDLIQKYKKTLQRSLGIHPDRISQYDSRTATKIHVTSKKMVHLFDVTLASISNGCKEKRMTMEGMTGSIEYLRGIMDGSNAGDGCIHYVERGDYNKYFWSTTSNELALQYSIILKSLEQPNSIQIRPAGIYCIEGREGLASESYSIYTKKNGTKIKDVTVLPEQSCYVYNLEVEDVHSYIVEGCVVHNCIYNEDLQEDANNPGLKEVDAYPALISNTYGWEKLFSEILYESYNRNYGIPVRIARFHNIFGIKGTISGGKEKAPAAICRKVAELPPEGGEIEVWGDGEQTRSFLYVDECIEATRRLMESDFIGPVNIGSEEMVTINQLVETVAKVSNKEVTIKHIDGPVGVRGRNSNNDLIREKLGWDYKMTLEQGIEKTYKWIEEQVNAAN